MLVTWIKPKRPVELDSGTAADHTVGPVKLY